MTTEGPSYDLGEVLGVAPRTSGRDQASWRATGQLALAEARRLVLHPATLTGGLLFAVSCLWPDGGAQQDRNFFTGLTQNATMWIGVAVYAAAALCASRARRAGTEPWTDALPLSTAHRTLALCLACLAPFAVTWAVLSALAAWVSAQQPDLLPPGQWRLLGGALTVLGGGLLGVMVSRWIPVPGAPLLVMIAVVVACTFLQEETGNLLSPFTDWVGWPNQVVEEQYVTRGSPAWHALYLLGLSVLAATGALLTHTRARAAALAVGVAATVVTVAAAVLQLPPA